MTQNTTCPRCGAPLPTGATPAQCPRCLLRIGLDTDFGGAPKPKRPPPSVAEIAREFPQLEVLELLGQGGMGAVYKARQKSLDRVVALKILTVDTAEDPAFAERFAREARALAALDHPNIVRVHDSGRAGERFYLVMEHVEGTDLRHMLRSGRIAPREGLAIVAQVCDALQYAHDQGVVHRDIKPENILVDRRGRVKIADFGLAKLVGKAGDAFALTGSQQAMGTPHYMAPEQFSHPQDVDHRADIYSLGVVLYELLTGELPLGRFAPPSQKVEVDVRVDEVVLKALERDLPRRYQHASEVRTSIDGLATPAPMSTEKTVRHEGAPVPKSQTLAGLAIVAAVSLVFVFGLTVAYWDRLEKGEITRGGLAIIIGPWSLIGVCSAVLLVVGLARRARAASRPVWPWFVGASCLLIVAVPLAIAFGLVLLGRPMPHEQTPALVVDPAAVGNVGYTAPIEKPGAHGPRCQRIEDSWAISARSVRMAELQILARESALSTHEQEHLVDALLDGGFFDENANGLMALLEHNRVAPETVQRIRREIRTENPTVHKTRVLEALAREIMQ